MKGENIDFILLSIFTPIAALIVGIACVCLVYQVLQKRQLKNGKYPNLRYVRHSTTLHENGCCTVTGCGKCSGSGFAKFAQRTAAQDLDLLQVIGEGKYGKVWRGLWHGDDVVAKLYIPSEEKSFKNEVDVNNKVGNHENILRVQHCHTAFSWNNVTYRCIVMEFHEHGSLYDFLNHRTVNIQEMCSLALSAARGLNHLHGEIYGRKEKYSIAHRDIKSKNIMVKANLTCAIGGLGLAVVHDRSEDKIITEDKRRGTARYMAPEVLDGAVFKSFESYKRSDVYSIGLVLWEITRRTLTEGNNTVLNSTVFPLCSRHLGNYASHPLFSCLQWTSLPLYSRVPPPPPPPHTVLELWKFGRSFGSHGNTHLHVQVIFIVPKIH